MNVHSSRSHTIFQIYIEQIPKMYFPFLNRGIHKIISKINLVDLAGSEKLHSYQLPEVNNEHIQVFHLI